MKKIFIIALSTLGALMGATASAQTVPTGYAGIWQTKEWFGRIANMQFVACDEGPYCIKVVSLVKGEGMVPGTYFMTDLTLKGKDMRDGTMYIPNGPQFNGSVAWKNERQVELQVLFHREIWERIK